MNLDFSFFNLILIDTPFKAYVVGGAVRDMLLGRKPKDIDLATPYTPDTVLRCCEEHNVPAKLVSERYGVVEIRLEGVGPIEVTTFRSDYNTDGRGCMTTPRQTIGEDLHRRDFTVNAMAFGLNEGLIDPFGGRDDLVSKRLRFVGDPLMRLEEDILRGIRALRFAGEYGLNIDNDTVIAIRHAKLGQEVYAAWAFPAQTVLTIERITQEMDKTFAGEHPDEVLRLMWEYNIIQNLLPEYKDADTIMQRSEYHPEGSVWTHIKQVVKNIPPEYRWEAFLHDIGKPACAEQIGDTGEHRFHGHEKKGAEILDDVTRRLKFSNERRASVITAAAAHMRPWQIVKSGAEKAHRRFWAKYEDHMDMLKALNLADTMDRVEPALGAFERPATAIRPIIMGRHLIEKGFEPGIEMGQRIKAAYNHQLDEGEEDFDVLLQVALSHKPAD